MNILSLKIEEKSITMSLIELLIAIFYIFIGIDTAIILNHEFNIFIGIIGFFITIYLSYYLLYEVAFKVLDYFHKCGRKITKFNKKRMTRGDNKIFGWVILISFITSLIIGYIYFVINLILGCFLHLIYLYICYGLNICKNKR